MLVRRAVLGAVASAGMVAVLMGAAAFACVTPPTVNLSTATGRPGDVVTINGDFFTLGGNALTAVQVRWGGSDGPVVAETQPDAAGKFKTTFTVPDGPPGFYAVAAVPKDAAGGDMGAHGRTLFEIKNIAAPPVTEPAAVSFTPSTDSSGSSFPIALAASLGVVGLVLFAGGFVAVTRSRRSSAAKPARVRND